MSESTKVYVCEHIGVSGTTPVHVRQNSDGTFEARCGIAILGSTNMDDAGFDACGHNPFHDKFYDNYASGTGKSEAEAIEALKADMHETANSIWAF